MVRDHKERVFSSYIECADAYGIPYELFRKRYNLEGWPLHEALETPAHEGIHIYDGDFEEYGSFSDMCRAHNILYATYQARRLRGWSKEDALQKEVVQEGCRENNLGEILHMLKNIEDMTLGDLLRLAELAQKANQEEAEVKSARVNGSCRKKTGPKHQYTDRNGYTFDSLRDACEAYDQNHRLCKHRLYDGWPLQYALEYPAKFDDFRDHKNQRFKTLAAMCNYYDIDKHIFADRMNDGWDLKDALTLPEDEVPVED